jgi:hypothetical protein
MIGSKFRACGRPGAESGESLHECSVGGHDGGTLVALVSLLGASIMVRHHALCHAGLSE